jgi:hypothetical protein
MRRRFRVGDQPSQTGKSDLHRAWVSESDLLPTPEEQAIGRSRDRFGTILIHKAQQESVRGETRKNADVLAGMSLQSLRGFLPT